MTPDEVETQLLNALRDIRTHAPHLTTPTTKPRTGHAPASADTESSWTC